MYFHPAGMSLIYSLKKTAILLWVVKRQNVSYVFSGIEERDNEGRVITSEFKEFYLLASREYSLILMYIAKCLALHGSCTLTCTNTRAITTDIIITIAVQ